MDKQLLESCIDEGLSTFKIAKLLNKSQTTVCYWLKKYRLKTKNKSPKQKLLERVKATKVQKCISCDVILNSLTGYLRNKNTNLYYDRCKTCMRYEEKNKRQALKQKSVNYKGGSCQRCGYNKNISSLDFHHLNPKEKEINLSKILKIKDWRFIRNELDKCVLLCANCHQQTHNEIFKRNAIVNRFNKFDVSNLTSIINTGSNTGLDSCKKCDKVLSEKTSVNKKRYPICRSCNSKITIERARKGKQKCVDYMGGKCSICDYSECASSLVIYNKHQNKYDKNLNNKIKLASFTKQKEYLKNCTIICLNCHREIKNTL